MRFSCTIPTRGIGFSRDAEQLLFPQRFIPLKTDFFIRNTTLFF